MDNETPILIKADNILLGNKPFSVDDPIFRELTKNIQYQHNYTPPKMSDVEFRNPNKKSEELLERVVGNQEEQSSTLHSIHYEGMKENAQLEVLLKVIDSQTDELERLKSTNQELQKINSILEEEQKHSTRNTVIWTIVTGVLLLGIEHWKDIYNFILSLIK